ncbi:MAG TPA: hypothetical protein VHB77_22775, partial [Planctomycetaceae bacterium]|nr:hypothetical protein [Planctomycetaceae bacterium]
MKNCFARCAVSALLFGLAVVTSATSAHAEELEVKGALAKPVLFVSAASVEQLVGEFNYAMDAIERHDIVKTFEEFRESSENLKGMDLTRPVGGMLLLEYLSPVWIGFIPIRDWDHFRETLEEFELKIEETGSNQYLIRGFGMDLFGVVRDGYLYVSDQKAGLKRRVPNPEEYAKQLHEDYDLAVTGQLTVIPEFLLTTAADWTLTEIVVSDESEKADAAPQTQDKIDEFAERLFRDGMLTLFKETQRVTLGWSVNRQERQARLDLVLAAKPGSVLARQLN